MAMACGPASRIIISLQPRLQPGSSPTGRLAPQLASAASFSNNGLVAGGRSSSMGVKDYYSGGIRVGERKRSGDAQRLLVGSSLAEFIVGSQLPTTFTHEEFEGFLLSMQDTICATLRQPRPMGLVEILVKIDGREAEIPAPGTAEPNNKLCLYSIACDGARAELFAHAVVSLYVALNWIRHILPSQLAMSARGRDVGSGAQYFAGALSLVFHSRSPYVPTFRSDVRYFEVEGGGGWFGGGADLTPSYLFEDDGRFFHKYYKGICDKFDPSQKLYSNCKEACDAYFYIPARKEHRGIGGIFFDDLERVGPPSSSEEDRNRAFGFVRAVAEGFMPSYLPIAHQRRNLTYGDPERQWQLLRRGRYLEFNLLYDRGVKFGLDGGRIESIMVSAPPLIAWRYNVTPEEDTEEGKLLQVLRKPKVWT